MNRPPLWMHLKIQKRDRKFGLWLPLFLLLPLALVVLILLSPLILIAIIVLWPSGRGRWALLVLRAAFVSFCSLRGLRLDFQTGNQTVFITII